MGIDPVVIKLFLVVSAKVWSRELKISKNNNLILFVVVVAVVVVVVILNGIIALCNNKFKSSVSAWHQENLQDGGQRSTDETFSIASNAVACIRNNSLRNHPGPLLLKGSFWIVTAKTRFFITVFKT